MKKSTSQCSPRYLETTTNLDRKGAYLDSTPNGIRVPTTINGSPLIYTTINNHVSRRTRLSPVIWEAKAELEGRGLVVLLLRNGSTVPLDIIAFDNRLPYGIVVRRIRSDPDIREISTRFSPQITALRTFLLPLAFRLQIWIYHHSTVRIYEICAGGLMSRSLP